MPVKGEVAVRMSAIGLRSRKRGFGSHGTLNTVICTMRVPNEADLFLPLHICGRAPVAAGICS